MVRPSAWKSRHVYTTCSCSVPLCELGKGPGARCCTNTLWGLSHSTARKPQRVARICKRADRPEGSGGLAEVGPDVAEQGFQLKPLTSERTLLIVTVHHLCSLQAGGPQPQLYGNLMLCRGGLCSIHCQTCRAISGFYPFFASNTPHPRWANQKCLQNHSG